MIENKLVVVIEIQGDCLEVYETFLMREKFSIFILNFENTGSDLLVLVWYARICVLKIF